MSLKTLFQTLVSSALHGFSKTLSKARSILVEASRKNRHKLMFYPKRALTKNQKKIFFGSFRLHYNWCSSHVVPVEPRGTHIYYDATWQLPVLSNLDGEDQTFGIVSGDDGAGDGQSELGAYLEWLEDKISDDKYDDYANDIDRLADLFISNCHEKFRLEKVESYRRFQEMLARGL